MIQKLLQVNRKKRLGHGGVERGYHDIMSHPFFRRNGVNWETLFAEDGPFVPDIEDDMDVGYFDQMRLSDYVPSEDEKKIEPVPEPSSGGTGESQSQDGVGLEDLGFGGSSETPSGMRQSSNLSA